ncbi:glycosyltransferase [Loktanella sp. IMCC34160]|uniref:glycosyltransferase family 4 protein n=1 Tax=Loktanella sp. IMCC34160 TaxID=2510646 RepID=UPI00101C2457|nr:glycosyltransferase family 4 protein [Loktanella sp. IMCC34160]RYG91445.1 glycosyltransferase [Loktanella sp. IMCC34160]
MAIKEPPAIFFHPDAVETKGKDLVGRRSAGESFLKGFLRHTPGDHVNAVTETPASAKAFEVRARELGETRPIKVDTLRGPSDFTRAGCIFFPGPGYLSAAWRRQRFGPQKCSLVGITHTVSTRRVIEGIHSTLNEPVEPWDAIICTSRAVHSVVARQLELEAEYMRSRYGATRVPQPRLPIIPLGIETADFLRNDDLRAEARAKFDVPEEAVVFLTVGRWTVIEKANPVPLFLALEDVAKSLGKPVHLWMVGWSSRDEEEKMHRDGAALCAPTVTTRMIDGRDPWVRRAIWSGADVFTLPVDNIQETFGLVPVEAMAASLPVVMPDWNGFRDTVIEGETGFLVPTRTVRPGLGRKIAERFADGTDDYVRYLSMVAQQTQIDLPAYTEALLRLARDPDLRERMGSAGATHAKARFDLATVVPQYTDLAEELEQLRADAVATTPPLRSGPVNPLEVDPFDLYRHYPSVMIGPKDIVTLARPYSKETLAALDTVNGRNAYSRKIVAESLLERLCACLEGRGPMPVSDLAQAVKADGLVTESAIVFLAKFGFVNISSTSP